LVCIPADDFRQLLLRNVAVGQQFIRLLAGWVREQQLLAMAYGSIRRRVADTLPHLHAQTSSDPTASIQLARDDMAAMVGKASELLIRTLSEFNQNGLIELMPIICE
jgi:CRP/FNR family cyclic AMP-dependent transcriptional regulator